MHTPRKTLKEIVKETMQVKTVGISQVIVDINVELTCSRVSESTP